MKIIIQTIYSNVTEEFLKDYLNHLSHNPELKEVAEELRNGQTVAFQSSDPSGPTVGITTYRIEGMK